MLRRLSDNALLWLDSGRATASDEDRIDLVRVLPFVLLHLGCLLAFVTGVSYVALVVCLLLFGLRMFGITAFYHRYFSHRSFRTSRFVQFLMACLGASAGQRGPLWWSSHHRFHHRKSDSEDDPHSPKRGFWNAHILWFLRRRQLATKRELVEDLACYPELVFLDRFDQVLPLLLAVATFTFGVVVDNIWPSAGTSGLQMLVWGFGISTVLLYHASFTINSVSHSRGSRRFETQDTSRNNLLLAVLTFGEGWHNNHHRYPVSARQGFRWWEVDLSYYMLRLMALFGLVWDLRPVPAALRSGDR